MKDREPQGASPDLLLPSLVAPNPRAIQFPKASPPCPVVIELEWLMASATCQSETGFRKQGQT